MGKNIDICHRNFCEKATKVDVLFEYIVPREESLDYDLLNDVYCLVKCKDCKAVFIKRIMDDISMDTVERIETIIPPQKIVYDKFSNYFLYPPHIYDNNRPYTILKMYREVLAAVNSYSFWLAFCGMRSVIEQVCQDKFSCKIGKFKDMENMIEQTGLISNTIKPTIISILDATHSSVHRQFFPTKEQTIKCLGSADTKKYRDQSHAHIRIKNMGTATTA